MRSLIVTAALGFAALGLTALSPSQAHAQQIIVNPSPGVVVTPAPPVVVAPAYPPPVYVTPVYPAPIFVAPRPYVVYPRYYGRYYVRPRVRVRYR